MLKTIHLFHKDNSPDNSSFFSFDLPILIEKMKLSNKWAKGELSSMVLLKSPEKHILLTALHEGTEIISFQSNDSITFQVIDGKLLFHTRNEAITLEKGHLLTLQENISYNLTARNDTVLLLTIANGILQPAEN